MGGQEEWRNNQRKHADIPIPPIPKSSGFLKAAGRTFSFGGQKKNMPPMPPTEEDEPTGPMAPEQYATPSYGRSRAATSSTSTTVTPPRVDGDFDLGGDFGKSLLGAGDKRASVATVRGDQNGHQELAPRALTGSRMNQPSPLQIDNGSKIEAPPHSWGSHHSNDGLLGSSSPSFLPPASQNAPPPVPRHGSPLEARALRPGNAQVAETRKPSLGPRHSSTELGDADDEEARLLKDSLSTVSKFMTGKAPVSGSMSTSRYRRNEDSLNDDDDSLFDTSHSYTTRSAGRFTSSKSSVQQSSKVMTPAEFEMYRKDKERQERREDTVSNSKARVEDDDDDNYEEDEDDVERAKQQAKQRRKQEAHMAVYRQQMMKVTGESTTAPPRPSLSISFSTPNLPNLGGKPSPEPNTAENSDDDEEVPLAILAAHGFPNKARPPNRLSTMMSNPNLRASQQPSYQRPASAMGEPSAAGGSRLPAFARNLPQDPFLGAGLIRNTVRESIALGGGSAAPSQPGSALPPGGLIGVIANEERSRALRRGSPHIDSQNAGLGGMPFDPIGGIPAHMMYPNNPPAPALTPGDQAQIQMTQQMQQFMQMQMQFMQMMTVQNANGGSMPGMMGPGSVGPGSMLGVPMGGPESMRHSFVGHDSMLDLPNARGDSHMRTMSMVQPSSASWVQLPQNPGFAPSIRIQGNGYTPSIAPSERSNVGLPGRYRPVSHVPPANPAPSGHLRKSSTMSGAIQPSIAVTKSGSTSDDDDEEGWEAMKAKRDKKKSSWKMKKGTGAELGAFIH
ncbi:hypothetical protein QBC47DRAFT_376403 [Echria macrotheca]|uniref:Uncharacterized protein n=1 Tax=Echria macrotheca TaxID=438768 RepID=A0AAJ0FDW1_9PEZI|nr:hypothetical protein QBC47DRAFT_376403 [Echria macrotheca]